MAKTKEKKVDDLRDPIIEAFHKCKVPMNRTSLNGYAIAYVVEVVGIREFSLFVEDKRSEEAEIMDIEEAYKEEGGKIVEAEETDETNELEEGG